MAFLMALIGLALSFGLAGGYAGALYGADRHEKEPQRLLLGMFLWGAFIATVSAALFSVVIDAGLSRVWGELGPMRELFDAVVIAPLVEESLKGAALLLLFALAHQEIDSLFDGIVYGALVGLGLALFRLYIRRWWAWFAPLAGWGAAVLAHALPNASMSMGGAGCLIGLGSDWLGLDARAHMPRAHRGPRERERLQRLQEQVQQLAPYAEVVA